MWWSKRANDVPGGHATGAHSGGTLHWPPAGQRASPGLGRLLHQRNAAAGLDGLKACRAVFEGPAEHHADDGGAVVQR